MKLSILILSYNERVFLSEAIESCMNQQLGDDYEIIIGDDGSSDGSIDTIKEYSQKFPQIISYFVMDRSDAVNVIPSIRASNVLKRAFKCAKGEYITVLSGDDLNLGRARLKSQVDFLDRNPRVMSCYVDYKMFWEDGQERDNVLNASLNERVFWGFQYVHISCFVFRRECLTNLLNRFCDDTGLAFSILKTGKSKHIGQIGFGYRQRPASIMHEADPLELSILELALYQDCLNAGGLRIASMSRFARPLGYVYQHRQELSKEKYRKYLNSCGQYSNDILGQISKLDSNAKGKNQILLRYFTGKCYWLFFKCARKANLMINQLLNR